jgi:hypothetical protein
MNDTIKDHDDNRAHSASSHEVYYWIGGDKNVIHKNNLCGKNKEKMIVFNGNLEGKKKCKNCFGGRCVFSALLNLA